MEKRIVPFMTFTGQAEAAMALYTSLFENSKIESLTRHPEGGPGAGTVMHAVFSLEGDRYMVSDSYVEHEWGFTPAISLFVTCADQGEQERLFAALSEDGKVFMPLDNYGFSARFGWAEDRFGVSWQLNVEHAPE